MPAADNNQRTNLEKCPIYIIMGSGGHTAEMCKINEALLEFSQYEILYKPARYVVAKTDRTSRDKIKMAMNKVGAPIEDSSFIEVPRSREVGQSFITAVFTTFYALLFSFYLVWRDKPKLILCNGPGTCAPFCLAAYLLRMIRRLSPTTKIVFVESFCRVHTLSLTGHLLMPLVDMFVVQWPALASKYNHKSNVKFFGKIM